MLSEDEASIDLCLTQWAEECGGELRATLLAAQALIRSLTADKDKAGRERDQWQQRESETQEALQAIGEEFGAHGGEPRTNAMRRLLTEDRARIAALEKALGEAERFMSYFAGETDGAFDGPGTPKSCLENIRTARALVEGRV